MGCLGLPRIVVQFRQLQVPPIDPEADLDLSSPIPRDLAHPIKPQSDRSQNAVVEQPGFALVSVSQDGLPEEHRTDPRECVQRLHPLVSVAPGGQPTPQPIDSEL